MFKISVCHPTARIDPKDPLWWGHSATAFLERCDRPEQVEYLLVVHASNWWAFDIFDTPPALRLHPWGNFRVIRNQGANTGNAQGHCATSEATGQILVCSMDDLFPPEHWDTLVEREFETSEVPLCFTFLRALPRTIRFSFRRF